MTVRWDVLRVWGVVVAAFLSGSVAAQQDVSPKALAAKYYSGVVKIILLDSTLALTDTSGADSASLFISRGSGFFVTSDGLILTNRHVVEDAATGYVLGRRSEDNSQLSFYTNDTAQVWKPRLDEIVAKGYPTLAVQVFQHSAQGGSYTLYRAQLLYYAKDYDGALLQVSGHLDGTPVKTNFTPLPLDMEPLTLGERLLSMGYASLLTRPSMGRVLEETVTLSTGVQSGLLRQDEGRPLIKTDLTVIPGSSGGPVFGERGTVVGINTATHLSYGVGLLTPITDFGSMLCADAAVAARLKAVGFTPQPCGGTDSLLVNGAIRLPLPSPTPLKAGRTTAGLLGDSRTTTDNDTDEVPRYFNLSVVVKDQATGQVLQGAQLEVRPLQTQGPTPGYLKGVTDNRGRTTLKVPSTYGRGTLVVEVQGYLRSVQPYDAVGQRNINLTLQLRRSKRGGGGLL